MVMEMRVGTNSSSQATPLSLRLNSFEGATDTRGRHRLQADLTRLDQESRFLQEELEKLEKMDKASASYEELLNNVKTRPDPLLPSTSGPLNPAWDRWFEGGQDSKGCRCWIF